MVVYMRCSRVDGVHAIIVADHDGVPVLQGFVFSSYFTHISSNFFVFNA